MADIKLSRVEKRILAAALECGQTHLTVEGIAQAAGCSAEVVCKRLQRPEFKQLFTEAVQSALVAETPAILNTFVHAAKEGSFKHGKLILEITGMHQETQKVELAGKVDVGESLFQSDEERREFLQATLADTITKKVAE